MHDDPRFQRRPPVNQDRLLPRSKRERPLHIYLPLAYLTRHYWQTKQLGQITYHYSDNINLTRARAFEKNNETIAKKLGLTPGEIRILSHRQLPGDPTLIRLHGLHDPERVGRTRDGSFTSAHQIFAIQHNEDFSHDLIHYYVSKIRTGPRNAAAEEGLAYYWGNAYYTGSGRNMFDYPAQLAALKSYMHEHPDTSLLSLFDHNAKPFPALAPEVSARSILSARLFQLIEETRGIEGVKTLINCGRGDDNYFKTLDTLTAIIRANFDPALRALLSPLNPIWPSAAPSDRQAPGPEQLPATASPRAAPSDRQPPSPDQSLNPNRPRELSPPPRYPASDVKAAPVSSLTSKHALFPPAHRSPGTT